MREQPIGRTLRQKPKSRRLKQTGQEPFGANPARGIHIILMSEVQSLSRMSKIETINPATGKILATYENVNADEVSRKVKAREASVKWKKLDVAERAEYMRRLGRVMRKNREEYARLVTEEMGKPIRQSLAEIEKCAWVCDYYAEHAEAFLRDEIIPTEFRKSSCRLSHSELWRVSCHGIFRSGRS